MIPLTKPYITNDEIEKVAEVLKSGWLAQGKKVEELEHKIAKYAGTKYAVATSSCTTALHISLILAGIGEGDEVIVPSLTFVATANSVLYTGATPIFAEIEQRTYNIDPKDIEQKITKKTKAIIPAHQAGLPAAMPEIMRLAKKYNLLVIEDAAPGLGSSIKGKMIGSFGHLNCLSFHPRKVITTAEGGMILTNNSSFAKKARILRSHGASVSDRQRHDSRKFIEEEYPVLGYNYRMSDVHAAIGLAQFKKISTILKNRQRLAKRYNNLLSKNPFIVLPLVPSDYGSTFQQYFISLSDNAPLSRNQLIQKLREKGIQTRIGIMAVHNEPLYKKLYPNISLPKTEKAARQIISLPIYTQMTEKEQDQVIRELDNLLN